MASSLRACDESVSARRGQEGERDTRLDAHLEGERKVDRDVGEEDRRRRRRRAVEERRGAVELGQFAERRHDEREHDDGLADAHVLGEDAALGFAHRERLESHAAVERDEERLLLAILGPGPAEADDAGRAAQEGRARDVLRRELAREHLGERRVLVGEEVTLDAGGLVVERR